jgi:hypothetical protein
VPHRHRDRFAIAARAGLDFSSGRLAEARRREAFDLVFSNAFDHGFGDSVVRPPEPTVTNRINAQLVPGLVTPISGGGELAQNGSASTQATNRSTDVATPVVLVPDVLTSGECRDLIDEMLAGPREPTNVLRAGHDEYAPSARKSESCYPRGPTRVMAEEQVERAARLNWPNAPDVASLIASAHYFRYPATGFVGPHRDRSPNHDDPREVRWRFASLVLFLNPAPAGNDFDGGALVVYTPRLNGPTVPTVVRPVAGTLAMFEPGLVHEVTRVRRGTRYSMVTWLVAENLYPEGNTAAVSP